MSFFFLLLLWNGISNIIFKIHWLVTSRTAPQPLTQRPRLAWFRMKELWPSGRHSLIKNMLFLTGILDTPTSQSVPLSLTVRRQVASLCETPEDVKRQERGSHVSQIRQAWTGERVPGGRPQWCSSSPGHIGALCQWQVLFSSLHVSQLRFLKYNFKVEKFHGVALNPFLFTTLL